MIKGVLAALLLTSLSDSIASGNLYLDRFCRFQELTPLDISLGGRPEWVTATPYAGGIVWVAMLESGAIEGHYVGSAVVKKIKVQPDEIMTVIEPSVFVDEIGTLRLTEAFPGIEPSEVSRVVRENQTGALLMADRFGTVHQESAEGRSMIDINALTDARPIFRGTRCAVLSLPSDHYRHGALGDVVEAQAITLLQTSPHLQEIRTIRIADGEVIEGRFPIWDDLNGDGQAEILVTQSNSQGARLVVYSEFGQQLAESLPIGLSWRWRHQLAAGPFGPEGELEIVDVRTPHLGGHLEFLRWEGKDLVLSAQISGYRSHVGGARNLEMAFAAQFGTSARAMVVVPEGRALSELHVIEHSSEGAKIRWRVPVGGNVTTNMAVAPSSSGELAVAVGRRDNTLRIWQDPGPKLPHLSLRKFKRSGKVVMAIAGFPTGVLALEKSHDLIHWEPFLQVPAEGSPLEHILPQDAASMFLRSHLLQGAE